MTVNVTPVNDAPVLTAPTTATTPGNTAYSFGSAINVSDVDGGAVTVTLTVNGGTLTAGTTSAVTATANAIRP